MGAATTSSLTSRAAVPMAVHNTRHRTQRRFRARDEVGTVQAMAAMVDDDQVFALERRLIEAEVLRAEVRGVVLSARRATYEIDKPVHCRALCSGAEGRGGALRDGGKCQSQKRSNMRAITAVADTSTSSSSSPFSAAAAAAAARKIHSVVCRQWPGPSIFKKYTESLFYL
jgi:hypothetical protein